jgi:membrane peptidoglycan carboxypeptidase
MILTWWIENSLDKDQIMELYLNVVEFGPAIYGIRNAALRYFGKHPSQLTVLECAFLAKMLPNPVSRYRYYQKGRSGLDPTWRKVLERVVGKMHERGYLDDSEYDQALASQLVFFYPDMVPPAREEGGNPMELVSAGTDIVHVPAGGDPAAQTGTAAGE